MRIKTVSVFAGTESHKDKEAYYYGLAYETGKLLARAGFTVATGAGPGLMNEAMRGATEAGGATIGVVLNVPGREQSKYASESFAFNTLGPRQDKLVKICDACIALPGGIGTLYEIANILALKRIGDNELSPEKPLILIGKFYNGFEKMFDKMISEGFATAKIHTFYTHVLTPAEAVEILKKINHTL